jgi:hypothetical protein
MDPAAEPPPLPPVADPDLMPSLGRLVRGLSILLWALPLTVVVSVQTARTSLLGGLGMVPPILTNLALLHALMLMGSFRRQERIWVQALDRARLLALLGLGLSPFLYWWRLMPEVPHYQAAVGAAAAIGLAFLVSVNRLLQRLTAMLPDETLRLEARLFTNLNLGLLAGVLLVTGAAVAWWTGGASTTLHTPLVRLLVHVGSALLLALLLLPLALTLTLIWKIRETILGSVFGSPRPR